MADITHTPESTIIRIQAPPLVDRTQLAAELAAAGSTPISGTREGSTLVISFDGEVDVDTVIEVVEAHLPSNIEQIDQLLAKAQQVWSGDDTFTQAQAQKILAGLVLVVGRYFR